MTALNIRNKVLTKSNSIYTIVYYDNIVESIRWSLVQPCNSLSGSRFLRRFENNRVRHNRPSVL